MSTTPTQLPTFNPAQVNAAESEQWRQIVRQALDDTRCSSPAFLAADMDYATQTCTVQIALQERVRTNAGAKWYDIPPITKVPVILPRGGGSCITLPLKQYDEGLLVFCDTCFDNWWMNGRGGAPPAANLQSGASPSGSQQQLEVRRHYVHDCGFWPGMWSQPNKLTNYSSSSMQIRMDDSSVIIDVSSSGVKVKSLSGTALALVNDNWFQWYVVNIQPFLVSKGYTGPTMPTDSETTILKGQ